MFIETKLFLLINERKLKVLHVSFYFLLTIKVKRFINIIEIERKEKSDCMEIKKQLQNRI